ncbi:glycoside hydrolase family 25 protein [Amycolatopsis sp. CA-230715]|uniref:glycoside hydrolase family 25 protein n=1 Tax=Amycolatopsis sp. CA-230715 TaxID=2745196 RepID=UPI001C00CD90|nr:glycoside hydrolase family 25 protein [Amycolatopsis sp. CA-230715]QWF81126.1 hypothetical protein HUW46_04552 [Amycolatopsis sp. CA-230715]
MALGIDIYRKFQTVTDWGAVKRHGVSFVYTKVSDGGGIATAGPADAIVNGAKSVGIPVGGYHYAQLTPSPERQAEVFVDEVRRLGALDLVPALDLEAPFGPNAAARDFGVRFCRRVAELGHRPGVYLNNAFAVATRPDQWGIPGLAIWIARYGARPDPAAGHYDVHQYSSTGAVPGIRAQSVDLNESYTTAHFVAQQGEDDMFTDADRQKLEAVFSIALNTPDVDGDGHAGDISLGQFRQWDYDNGRALAAKLDALTAAVARSGGITAEQLAAALRPGLVADVLPALRAAVADVLGADNEHQADEIASAVLDKLGAKLTTAAAQ